MRRSGKLHNVIMIGVKLCTMVAAGGILPLALAGCCGSAKAMKASYRIVRSENVALASPGGYRRVDVLDSASYLSYPELIGVCDVGPEPGSSLSVLMQELGLEDVTDCYGRRGKFEGLVLRKIAGGDIGRMHSGELQALRAAGFRAGPPFRMKGGGFLVFSNQVQLKFTPKGALDAKDRLFSEFGVTKSYPIPEVWEQHVVTLDPGLGEGVNDVVEQMLKTGVLETAYPVFWASEPDRYLR